MVIAVVKNEMSLQLYRRIPSRHPLFDFCNNPPEFDIRYAMVAHDNNHRIKTQPLASSLNPFSNNHSNYHHHHQMETSTTTSNHSITVETIAAHESILTLQI
ncbi:hypothetical protein ACTFIR_002293 [Dictyostelium discoideum]